MLDLAAEKVISSVLGPDRHDTYIHGYSRPYIRGDTRICLDADGEPVRHHVDS